MSAPNILLITSDQQNAETLGCAGNPVIRTPHLDALAGEGALFSQAFTPFPICTPARTSIFTGQFARRHGVRHNINMRYQPGAPALSPESVAFPELLAARGWRTSFFGKLHTRHEGGKNFGLQLARLVEGKGHFMPAPDQQDEYRKYLLNRGYPPDIWKTWELPEYKRDGCVTSPLPNEDYIDTFIADMAVEHLRRVEGPFFCWVSFCTPHTALDPPQPYDKMYDPALIPAPHRRQGELETKHPSYVNGVARTIYAEPFTSQDPSRPEGIENAYRRFPDDLTRRMRAAYYGEVSHLDAQVGRVLETLKARGLYQDTLIIFTSDHGDYCGNNWAFYKHGGLYDSLIRVPMIVRWPDAGAAGQRVPALVSLVDIMPTILAAAKVPCPDGVDGKSLRGLLAGEASRWRDELVVECGAVNALLTPQWKYIRWKDGFEELYDRVSDPHDLSNVSRDPSLAPTREDLARRLASWRA